MFSFSLPLFALGEPEKANEFNFKTSIACTCFPPDTHSHRRVTLTRFLGERRLNAVLGPHVLMSSMRLLLKSAVDEKKNWKQSTVRINFNWQSTFEFSKSQDNRYCGGGGRKLKRVFFSARVGTQTTSDKSKSMIRRPRIKCATV